jgi:ferredoxin-NADP reductase/truncated hemoglobin YjbI/ferredoxin
MAAMARITFEGNRYPLLEGEDALQALLRGGAKIPFSCRKGTCQSCLLRAVEGDPGSEARAGLRAGLASAGYFLPCKASPAGDLLVARTDPTQLFVRMHVQEKELVAPDVARILLEPETEFRWRPGQFVNVRHPDGAIRSYSLASLPLEDYYVELHVKRLPGGKTSGWLVDEVETGTVLDVQGPVGECVWSEADCDRPLLLMGTGTGLSPLLGIAREALLSGHRGDVFLYHGAREQSGLYRHAQVLALVESHPQLHYFPCVSAAPAPESVSSGRIVEHAARRHRDLTGFAVYLCGLPAMVHEARAWAFQVGAAREDIHADPFELTQPFMPDDGAKLAKVSPDPELWEALGRGTLLRIILTDFYRRVYADPRLSPFFHKVTMERAIDKQYEFLADVFTRDKRYFGLKPFNAHHWMVISDELFDYRERLIESCMRRHGLAEHLIRRWCTLHETFRREIVKATPRGLIVDGVEREVEKITEEMLDVASVCDGCSSEMPVGSRGRLNSRTGELFCGRCAARRVGTTLEPPSLQP